MTSIIRLVAMVAGLVLMLHSTPSWGQSWNPTESDANGNTAGGTGALEPSQGFNNTAFGGDALFSNETGIYNTASGASALFGNHTGNNNTASGANALYTNNNGDANTASGAYTLYSNSSGSNNAAHGLQALYSNTSGGFNTATGTNALYSNDTGSFNTAAGGQALYYNVSGVDNTALGVNALVSNTFGNNNTALGTNALLNSTGNSNKNIAIGYQAGINLTGGSNNIYLGSVGGDGAEAQTIRIGKAQTRTFIAGIANASGSGATVEINTSTGQLGVLLSSARYKQDIAPMGSRSEKVLDLRPVTFAYRDDVKGATHYGLIAEEVAKVYPELVTHTATGEVQTVRYQELIPMLLNELQRQRQEFQQALQRQQQELTDLRALVGQGRETASLAR